MDDLDEDSKVTSTKRNRDGQTPDGAGDRRDSDDERLPVWWRRAIEEHERFGLRPYRPPRLADGSLLQPLIDELSTELNVQIRCIGVNVSHGDDWTIRVDDEPVADIGRRKDDRGHTVYELSRERFAEIVRTHVAER